MIRIDAIWLALGTSDLRFGMDTLLARVVREVEGGACRRGASSGPTGLMQVRL